MAMVIPSVALSDSTLTAPAEDTAVTTPLFIGYTLNTLAAFQSVKVQSLNEAQAITGSQGEMYLALRHFFDNHGSACYLLSLGQQSGDAPQNQDAATERALALLSALEQPALAEAIEAETHACLLVVPEMRQWNHVALTPVEDDHQRTRSDSLLHLWQQGWMKILSLCRQRSTLFALLETPTEITLTRQLVDTVTASNLHQAAAWWPALITPYPGDNGQDYLTLSPTAAMAAVIQWNARRQGVWCAPANTPLAKTIRPTLKADAASVLQNNAGVTLNLIRSLPGKGVRPWGCRTLLNDPTSPWRYIQTRLLVNYVTSQLSVLARAWLFEPNTALTWMKLKGQAHIWLRQLWLNGAFYGTNEEDAFALDIGMPDTMTAEEINAGIMRIRIHLALLAPAEFYAITLAFDTRNGMAVQNATGEAYDGS